MTSWHTSTLNTYHRCPYRYLVRKSQNKRYTLPFRINVEG